METKNWFVSTGSDIHKMSGTSTVEFLEDEQASLRVKVYFKRSGLMLAHKHTCII